MALSSVAENSSRWPAGRCRVEDPLHAGQEAEVGHVVGLVEHGDLHRVEAAVALTDQVLEAARAGDDDVDALAQRRDLRALADAAVDGGDAQRHCCCQRLQRGHDLVGQLTGGYEDEGTRLAGLAATAACRESDDERQGEGDGLATAGLAAAEHVVAEQRVGKRGRLDREGGGDAAGGEDCDQRGRHAEGGEVGDVVGRRNGLSRRYRRDRCSEGRLRRYARSAQSLGGGRCYGGARRVNSGWMWSLWGIPLWVVGRGCKDQQLAGITVRSKRCTRPRVRVRTPPSNILPLNWQNRADTADTGRLRLWQRLETDRLHGVEAEHRPPDAPVGDLLHVERRAAWTVAADDVRGDRGKAAHEVLHALDDHDVSLRRVDAVLGEAVRAEHLLARDVSTTSMPPMRTAADLPSGSRGGPWPNNACIASARTEITSTSASIGAPDSRPALPPIRNGRRAPTPAS